MRRSLPQDRLERQGLRRCLQRHRLDVAQRPRRNGHLYDIALPQCAYVGDAVAADYMAAKGMTEETLSHSKATTGGGATHRGKTVKPFADLNEADFAILDEALTEHVGACLAG